MFKPSSPYKTATLVYWAARSGSDAQIEPYFIKDVHYAVGHKKRKLIFLKNITHQERAVRDSAQEAV
jgi:hypothetical protein